MGVRDLTTVVEKYLCTHVGDKPRAYAIGTSGYQKPSNTSGVSGSVGKHHHHLDLLHQSHLVIHRLDNVKLVLLHLQGVELGAVSLVTVLIICVHNVPTMQQMLKGYVLMTIHLM